jgi:pilus assembly protein CpaE
MMQQMMAMMQQMGFVPNQPATSVAASEPEPESEPEFDSEPDYEEYEDGADEYSEDDSPDEAIQEDEPEEWADDYGDSEGDYEEPEEPEDEPEPEPEPEIEPEAPKKNKNASVATAKEIKSKKQKREDDIADEAIDEDILSNVLKKKQTRVIAVYAAKGGVGKTSISTELAVCLALTTNGRRRFRVCIVDYNIDFGDVATTLEFSDDGPNMSYWAAEIQERLMKGESPDELRYSREEMETNYLQQMSSTGLYALCAPITHEDSMLIKPPELQVMLHSIIENGEFDFVICDTGNNTRDSTIIALDNAEYILLVATQDVTTANCNASVLRTLADSGFDTDKVRLVINNVMSSRETGISVQEVEEAFPYQCVCRIKRTNDIIKANNLSRPLVYKANHEYTKQIRRIVQFVTQGDIESTSKGHGMFGRK